MKDLSRRTSKDQPAYSYNPPDRGPLPKKSSVRLAGESYDPRQPGPNRPAGDLPGPMHGNPLPLFQSTQQWPPPRLPAKPSPPGRTNGNPAKPGKTKLNLLNPMSLLARRRSSQKVAEAAETQSNFEGPVVPVLRLPDNYDPRIRGKGIHDFSAPRSAHSNPSPPKSSSGQWSSQSPKPALQSQDGTPNSTDKEHTPVFKENFDDGETWQEGRDGPTKRQKSAFMYQMELQEPYAEPDPSTLPAFARNLPAKFPGDSDPIPRVSSPPRAPLEIVLETALSDSLPKEASNLSSPPTSPRSKGRSRASSDADSGFVPAGLPKHFKSNASRFSFDYAGVGSAAQEKLLEERHREKAKEKARARASSTGPGPGDDADDDDDDPDLDDLDLDDDGLEERIPGVNADVEEEEVPFSMPLMPAMGTLSSMMASNNVFMNTMSPVSEGFSPISSPDNFTEPVASMTIEPSPNLSRDGGSPSSHRSSVDEPRSQRESGTTVESDIGASPELQPMGKETLFNPPLQPTMAGYEDEDDMYFDDGMIEDLVDDDGQAFDETVFDDESSRVYGLPIRDLPKQQQLDIEDPGLLEAKGHGATISDVKPLPEREYRNSGDDAVTDELRDSLRDLSQTSRPVFSQTAGLTQDNLAAYHDALALATNQAAMNGKFIRRPSIQSEQSLEQPVFDSDPYPMVGASPSLEVNGYPMAQNNDYDFDDAESDDGIIAAANAEALENDDEDFYGQEFGFYARKTGAGEYANGGYFGPGVQRTHSGRNVEPALTPITERSEWSKRNSAISLALHGYPSTTLPQATPDLAQLADMMHLEEDNMSLSALMKLRRGAWGNASTTSLQSSSGTSGSPLTYLPPMPSNAAALQYQQMNQSNPVLINTQHLGASTHSLNSSGQSYSADNDSPIASEGSQTLTLQNMNIPTQPNPAMNAPFMASSYSNSSDGSPILPSPPVRSRPQSGLNPQKAKGHSRNTSKESVSYVHERDEDGDKWVLEKRRVGEGGIVEVLGREVVEGGRI